MSTTAPTPITALPTAPSTASPSNFDALADAFIAALATLRTETNAISTVNYNNAVDAFNNAASAAVNAALAVAAGAAPLWVSGTTYTVGQAVISPTNLRAFRRKVGGAGTTDPVSDTTNWQAVSIGPVWITKTTTYTAIAGDAILADTSGGTFTITLPASPVDNDTVQWKDKVGTFGTNKLTFGRNGKNIMGSAADMDVSTSNLNGTLTFIAATNDWRF